MPVDVTVNEPGTRVVGFEADDSGIALGATETDDVAPDGVEIIIFGGAGAADDGEGVLWRKRRCKVSYKSQ